jgi:hypothetical protein
MIPKAEVDGWTVCVQPQNDPAFPWRAVAFDSLWAREVKTEGFDVDDVLSSIASKTGIDRKDLLAAFGL